MPKAQAGSEEVRALQRSSAVLRTGMPTAAGARTQARMAFGKGRKGTQNSRTFALPCFPILFVKPILRLPSLRCMLFGPDVKGRDRTFEGVA